MKHAFDIGAQVEVLTARVAAGDVWQPAQIFRHEPYRGRPGYYVHYPNAKAHECSGGWKPEHLVRKIAS